MSPADLHCSLQFLGGEVAEDLQYQLRRQLWNGRHPHFLLLSSFYDLLAPRLCNIPFSIDDSGSSSPPAWKIVQQLRVLLIWRPADSPLLCSSNFLKFEKLLTPPAFCLPRCNRAVCSCWFWLLILDTRYQNDFFSVCVKCNKLFRVNMSVRKGNAGAFSQLKL